MYMFTFYVYCGMFLCGLCVFNLFVDIKNNNHTLKSPAATFFSEDFFFMSERSKNTVWMLQLLRSKIGNKMILKLS